MYCMHFKLQASMDDTECQYSFARLRYLTSWMMWSANLSKFMLNLFKVLAESVIEYENIAAPQSSVRHWHVKHMFLLLPSEKRDSGEPQYTHENCWTLMRTGHTNDLLGSSVCMSIWITMTAMLEYSRPPRFKHQVSMNLISAWFYYWKAVTITYAALLCMNELTTVESHHLMWRKGSIGCTFKTTFKT